MTPILVVLMMIFNMGPNCDTEVSHGHYRTTYYEYGQWVDWNHPLPDKKGWPHGPVFVRTETCVERPQPDKSKWKNYGKWEDWCFSTRTPLPYTPPELRRNQLLGY